MEKVDYSRFWKFLAVATIHQLLSEGCFSLGGWFGDLTGLIACCLVLFVFWVLGVVVILLLSLSLLLFWGGFFDKGKSYSLGIVCF